MQQLARLAVYVTALVVVFTARLPLPVSTLGALRASSPGSAADPVRLLIASVLLIGVLIELFRRRTVWP